MKKPTILLITLIALAAFMIGRASVKQTHEVVYTKGTTMKGSTNITLPFREIQPIAPTLPYKYIFIENIKREVVDTAKIIDDYIAERTYSLTLFDNLHGRLDITPTIQYNKLTALPFTFTPIEKTVLIKKEWVFFSTASYNTFNSAGIGGGFFYKNVGMHYKYLWNTRLNAKGHEVGINVLF